MSEKHRSTARSIALLAILQVCFSATADSEFRLTESRELVQALGMQLQTALQTALAHGGPIEAVHVCRDRAPQIAAELSKQSGARVSRISRRFRNPDNAASPWQVNVLEQYELEMAENNSLPESIEYSPDGVHYMKAIQIKPLCTVCHGTNIADELRTTIEKTYPNDLATGYKLNDLRGAFIVSWPETTSE